ncbi:MAG: aminoacyl-tRNA hydrolase [Clostridia bacterium]|nr:aminoacyl-tRNA hydrolase [Clostridia bacterium]MBR4033765.1 aminoacyl-tRNA hydrolase [Clostridia bacterium]
MDLFRQIETSRETGGAVSYLVVGLGNPGKEYAETRHNVGFRFIDALAQKQGVRIDRAKFHSLVADVTLSGKRILLVKPQTFMNSSGIAVKEAADFYKIPPERILVVYDDISLDPGRVRVRKKGSDGGHNGMKSIIGHLSSDAFPRVRIGVGAKPHKDYDLADWVLGVPSAEVRTKIAGVFPTVTENLPLMLSEAEGDFEKAVQACNGYRA